MDIIHNIGNFYSPLVLFIDICLIVFFIRRFPSLRKHKDIKVISTKLFRMNRKTIVTDLVEYIILPFIKDVAIAIIIGLSIFIILATIGLFIDVDKIKDCVYSYLCNHSVFTLSSDNISSKLKTIANEPIRSGGSDAVNLLIGIFGLFLTAVVSLVIYVLKQDYDKTKEQQQIIENKIAIISDLEIGIKSQISNSERQFKVSQNQVSRLETHFNVSRKWMDDFIYYNLGQIEKIFNLLEPLTVGQPITEDEYSQINKYLVLNRELLIST
ncbi:MAG: hypothetical protein HQK99_17630 [Nitrospirae bacterium]|nr:hypothetical protein [Nitrospirota bacterium]